MLGYAKIQNLKELKVVEVGFMLFLNGKLNNSSIAYSHTIPIYLSTEFSES